MTTIVLRLAVIALLLYAGVALWYGRMEKRLQEDKPVVKSERLASPMQEMREMQEADTPAADGYQIILTRNIFQSLRQVGDRPQTDLDDLAETSLRLVLLGTITGDREDARAIIRDEKTKLEDLYQTGSEVQGALISRISRGKVALLVNGREEVLTIKDPEGEDAGRDLPVDGGGAAQRQMGPTEDIEHKVPQAMPRRRISFRNTEMPAMPDVSEQQAPGEGPPEMNDLQPLPDDEPPAPDGGQGQPTEQGGQ